MAKTPTQKDMVLQHLKEYGSLDPFTAFKEYGIFTGLHARITELRKEGHDIRTGHISGVSAVTGRKWQIANYIYTRIS